MKQIFNLSLVLLGLCLSLGARGQQKSTYGLVAFHTDHPDHKLTAQYHELNLKLAQHSAVSSFFYVQSLNAFAVELNALGETGESAGFDFAFEPITQSRFTELKVEQLARKIAANPARFAGRIPASALSPVSLDEKLEAIRSYLLNRPELLHSL